METLLLLGFALGLKHSTDADHIAAVSALASSQSNNFRLNGACTGALWGAGHLLAVLLAGGTLIVWRVNLPDAVAWALELLVACVLIGLGVRTICDALRGRLHFHTHRHGGWPHAHLHFHAAAQTHDQRAHDSHLPGARRNGSGAFFLGTLHGLAGTAGLSLLVLATIPSRASALLYLLTFGAGALIGMTLFSTILSTLLGTARHNSPRWLPIARLATGAANAVIGIVLAHRVLISSL